MATESNTTKGSEFEAYVQTLYESLGYAVERNLRLHGQQVDLIARKSLPGAGSAVLLVECKYIRRGALSNQAVHEFATYLEGVRNRKGITAGVLVCSRDFSLDAKAAAEEQPFLQLKRLVDIERELFDVADILAHKIKTFETEEIFSQYIPLTGKGRLPGAQGDAQFSDVMVSL
ncbi:MAG: restriction endonuclease, partial [Acetobacteraceae bacterium]|nr:restriction endonuclease [Acetobacteraceae bacterium]